MVRSERPDVSAHGVAVPLFALLLAGVAVLIVHLTR